MNCLADALTKCNNYEICRERSASKISLQKIDLSLMLIRLYSGKYKFDALRKKMFFLILILKCTFYYVNTKN